MTGARQSWRKNLATVALLTLAMLTCLALAGTIAFWSGIIPLSTPEHDPTELLIDISAFPNDWEQGEIFTDRLDELYRYARQAASQDFDHPANHDVSQNGFAKAADHLVSSYDSTWFAHQEYQIVVDRWFGMNDHYIPPNVDVTPRYADEFRFGCIDFTNPAHEPETRCRLVSRYGQYISEFRIITKSTSLKKEDLGRIINAIELRFLQVLN